MSGTRINVGKTGLVLGLSLSAWHLGWSILVALSWAQPFIDFVFWMHFIKPVLVVEAFDFGRAAILLVVTGAFGLAIGSIFASIWNAFHEE